VFSFKRVSQVLERTIYVGTISHQSLEDRTLKGCFKGGSHWSGGQGNVQFTPETQAFYDS